MIYDNEILEIFNDLNIEISIWERIKCNLLIKEHLISIYQKYIYIEKIINKNIYKSILYTSLSLYIGYDISLITFLYFYLKLKSEFELLRKIKIYIDKINNEII